MPAHPLALLSVLVLPLVSALPWVVVLQLEGRLPSVR